MIIILLILAVLVFIIFSVAGVANKSSVGGDERVKTVYAYIILFATLMMMLGGSIVAFSSVADILMPQPYYQSFQEYQSQRSNEVPKIKFEQVRKEYEFIVKIEKEKTKNRGVSNLIKSVAWIIIPLPIFLRFQRKTQNQKNQDRD